MIKDSDRYSATLSAFIYVSTPSKTEFHHVTSYSADILSLQAVYLGNILRCLICMQDYFPNSFTIQPMLGIIDWDFICALEVTYAPCISNSSSLNTYNIYIEVYIEVQDLISADT